MQKQTSWALALTLAALVGMTASTMAQTPPPPAEAHQGRFGGERGPGGMRGGGMRHLLEELNLSDKQKAQIKTIQQADRPKMMAVRNDASLAPDQKKSKMMVLRKENQAKIMEVLTPAQKAKFKSLLKEAGKKGGKGDKAG